MPIWVRFASADRPARHDVRCIVRTLVVALRNLANGDADALPHNRFSARKTGVFKHMEASRMA